MVANAGDFAHWFGDINAARGALALERARSQLGHEAIHAFAAGSTCYLWNVMAGSVRIAVDSARTCLWLTQIEYADDDACRAKAHAYAVAFGAAQEAQGLCYRVPSGPVVITCSVNSVSDSSTSIGSLPLAASSPGALIDFAGGPNAAAVWIAPGLYQSSLFFHEDDRWGVSWCRLQRISD